MQLHTKTNSHTNPKEIYNARTHTIKHRHAQTNAHTNKHTHTDGDANAKSPNIAKPSATYYHTHTNTK